MGRSSQKQKMPNCSYGAACTRKDCVYSHPPRPKKGTAISIKKSDKVCLPYLAGVCTYGRNCWDLHPEDPEEINRICEEFAQKPCHFGSSCHNTACLYGHPNRIASENEQDTKLEYPLAEESVGGGGITTQSDAFLVEDSNVVESNLRQVTNYRDMLVSYFKAINQLPMIEKVDLMLTRFEGKEESLLESLASKYGVPFESIHGYVSNPTSQTSTQHVNTDGSISNSTSALSAAIQIDDISKRLSSNLELAENDQNGFNSAQEYSYFSQQQQPYSMKHLPPPPQEKQQQQKIVTDQAFPPPQRWKKAPHLEARSSQNYSSSLGNEGGWGGYKASTTATAIPRKKVPIPTSLWTMDVSRDAATFAAYQNPIERFYAVNKSIALSTSSTSTNSQYGSPLRQHQPGVLDLHFQSTRTVVIVLDTLLDSELTSITSDSTNQAHFGAVGRGGGPKKPVGRDGDSDDSKNAVWLITGTGHHTGNSHVKAGALFEAVEQYLIEGGYDFAYGKDGAGRSGAFAVYKKA